MSAERVVLDTNVLISAALIASSRPFEVLQDVMDTGVLIFSNETFDEITTRLMRPRFDRYVSAATRQAFLADLAAVAEWTAIAGRANCLVTGDTDLLELHPFRGLAIMTLRGFLTNEWELGSRKSG